jgi:glycosyltransferase involved in cell wall biosynthesis
MPTPPLEGSVLLIAPAPPPYGGMALQAKLLEKYLRRDGLTVVFFPANFSLPKWLGPLSGIPGLRTLLRAILIWMKLWCQMQQVEVVHVLAASWLYFFLVVCPAITVGRVRGKRVILNYRGGGAEPFFSWFGWAVRPWFKAASVVTAPSDFLADLIRRFFHTSVVIVPNIVDSSSFRFRQRSRIQPKLLVTRHLEKIYDIDSVLKAFGVIQQHHPEATLWIAGTGSEESHLRSLVPALGLVNVRFLGHVAQLDLPAICDQCGIYLNASRVDNFPGALLEASAAGLPIVSTCAGGIPFIYTHEKNALLCEPGDWQALAAAVEEVLTLPSLALRLSNEGSALAKTLDWLEVRRPLYLAYGIPVENDEKALLCEDQGLVK